MDLPDVSLSALALGGYRAGLRAAVLQFKTKGAPELAQALARVLAGRLRCHRPQWLVNQPLLVPVAASPSRSRHRGHKPVELLALALGEQLGLPVDPRVLQLVGDPAPRKLLSRDQRYAEGGVRFRALKACGAVPVLLIDDVITSGQTLARAAQALQKAGWHPLGAVALAASDGSALPSHWAA